MKTTVNLTIHASSEWAAKFVRDYLRMAMVRLHRSGDAPVNTFLEYGEPKGIRHGKKKK